MSIDARHVAPAVSRNRDPLLAVLRRVLPPEGTVLEIASGSGEHAVFFASRLPAVTWQPSDPNPSARASIAAWTSHERTGSILPPLDLDAAVLPWPVSACAYASVVCINMIHIAPWASCLGLLVGSASVLSTGAPLVLYGPFKRDGVHTAPSNAAFDADLRARDSRWGVRDLVDVSHAATEAGFALDEVVEMPANNLTVVFRREARQTTPTMR